MTEQQLVEAVGLVARIRRLEQLAESEPGGWASTMVPVTNARLAMLGVEVPSRGWRPPVTIGPDVA